MDQNIRLLEQAAIEGGFPEALALESARNRVDPFGEYEIEIDGEIQKVYSVEKGSETCPWMIELDDGSEYFLAEDSESAGEMAKARWTDMAKNDPREFAAIIGTETLVSWGLGQYAGPGSTQVKSLDEWLDLWIHTPEGEWAAYDLSESEVGRVCPYLLSELGFIPTVAYRCN